MSTKRWISKLPALAVAAMFCMPSSVRANCEAGADLMHTIAQYGSGAPDTFFFLYTYDPANQQLMLQATAGAHGSVGTGVERESIRLMRGKASCSYETAIEEQESDPDSMEPTKVKVPLAECAAFAEGIPRSGYLKIDHTTGTWFLPTELALTTTTQVPTAEQAAAIRTRSLARLTEWLNGNPPHTRALVESDVVNLQQPDITRTMAGESFSMWAVRYHLANLTQMVQSLAQTESPPPVVGFPIVYFQRAKETPFFIGDGSWCALYDGFPRPTPGSDSPGSNIPEIDRFTLTKAFDLSGDGLPDVLELNRLYAYHLDQAGKLWVIHYGEGC